MEAKGLWAILSDAVVNLVCLGEVLLVACFGDSLCEHKSSFSFARETHRSDCAARQMSSRCQSRINLILDGAGEDGAAKAMDLKLFVSAPFKLSNAVMQSTADQRGSRCGYGSGRSYAGLRQSGRPKDLNEPPMGNFFFGGNARL